MSVWGHILAEHAKLGSQDDLDSNGNVSKKQVVASNDSDGAGNVLKIGDLVFATTMGRMQKTLPGVVESIKPTSRGIWLNVKLDRGGNLLTRSSLVKHR